jgi:hypothetical protein
MRTRDREEEESLETGVRDGEGPVERTGAKMAGVATGAETTGVGHGEFETGV